MLRKRATNVQRHYDIGDDLFEAFLDPTLTYFHYSCTCWDGSHVFSRNALPWILVATTQSFKECGSIICPAA